MAAVRWTIFLSLVLVGSCFSNRIIQGPQDTVVLQGGKARFNCTVSLSWTIIIWIFKGNPVLTSINGPGGAIITNIRFSQQNYSSNEEFTSELIISNVNLNDSRRVECNLQDGKGMNARLFVQVNGSLCITNKRLTVLEHHIAKIVCEASSWFPAPNITWMINDTSVDPQNYITNISTEEHVSYNALSTLNVTPSENILISCLAAIEALPKPQTATVSLTVVPEQHQQDGSPSVIIIAVLVSVGLLLLVIIIVIVIILLCLKQRKKSSYREELRKKSSKKTPKSDFQTEPNRGKDNHGFSSENTRDSYSIGDTPGHNYRNSRIQRNNNSEVADVTETGTDSWHEGYNERSGHTQQQVNPRKTRHITAV
ncbi:immunoglobulin superfamily member 5 [Latimeria chalumnae]|uniref:immunoglobulin superfamily member 5 n=1 Tax=Latimeria chalumnae TaxID=7897 RepID=UPI0006D8F9A7|nr:PREDICTED: immunoglobulin superfamily member 5 [Latimeria chalumnae]|eukprot:XP_014342020.1 PREDICTED: immunoglobulin superfamily member 5 [Latimeria chalumnae]